MNSFRTMLTATTVTALAFGVAGCAVDRAGGKAADPVTTLTFAQGNDGVPAQIQSWADLVEQRSDGSLKIRFRNGWRLGETDSETGIVSDVKAGKADLAWVGARVFDRLGDNDFQALLAPMLVDSHALQQAVFEEGIPDEMLGGVSDVGVTGVAVLPGPMRKVLGISKPYLEPGDFQGATVGMQDSALTQQTLEAWGAEAVAEPSGASLEGLDAYEQQLASINGNGYVSEAKYVTGNLDLWPRPMVIVGNADALDGLSDQQREALDQASSDAVLPALDASRTEDAEGADELCQQGMQLVDATEDQLLAMARAAGPAYDAVAAEPQGAAWLDRIQQLKDEVGAGPDDASCEPGSVGQDEGVLPDGTYRTTLTTDYIHQACKPGDPGSEGMLALKSDEILEITVDGDHIVQTGYRVGHPEESETGYSASYRTFRNTFELTQDSTGLRETMTFDFDGSSLMLSDMQTEYCDDRAVWTGHPWELVAPGSDDQGE